ncbi:PleD family two-component system response regulator [Oryzibacter oryziterrae]|uniref:PleD family two-component system response regulator n=1 Tax=Oryzibacter oryziterrae TaxID=2766474 RepID=UPI001EFFA44E|nr:PleD family two-component system response regulator [Oryzibacter oryziterrae]
MTARILVVDDIAANVRLLEARLTAEYFDVHTATSGAEALDMLEHSPFDIVLLDVMMPGMDGFEVCRRIRANPKTTHVPVIMVTALDQVADRVNGLEAGADDFLTKPVSDVQLITRVKSLVRLKLLTDELTLRANQGNIGMDKALTYDDLTRGNPSRILIVDDRRSSYERLSTVLASESEVEVETNPQEALFRAAENPYDLLIVNITLADHDALRLCSQIRSLERTRMLPILLITEMEDTVRLQRGLDLGVNDYLIRPIDKQELLARARTQIRRKRYTDRLRDNVLSSMEMAITDSLTNLYNRRYLDGHLKAVVAQSQERRADLSLLIIDIDHFKRINDTHGHDAGDDILREFAARIRKNLRGIDLACRYGGEEFVVVMPDTDYDLASLVAERLRQKIAREPFAIAGGSQFVDVTISIGLSRLNESGDSVEALLKRADTALYRAKNEGRNRVVLAAA